MVLFISYYYKYFSASFNNTVYIYLADYTNSCPRITNKIACFHCSYNNATKLISLLNKTCFLSSLLKKKLTKTIVI